MTIRRKIIIGFTLTAVGAACAGLGGLLPLLDARAAFRISGNSAAETAVSRALEQALLATTCSIAITVLTGLLVAGALSRRLRRFREEAAFLAGGIARRPVPVIGNDELAEATHSLNELNARLETLRAKQISEEEVLAAKRYADNIIHSMFDIVIVTNPDLRIRSANQATCELLGYTELQLLGRSIEELFKEESILLRPPIKELLRSGPTRNFEAVYRTSSGHLVDVLLSASTMRDTAGRPIAIITVAKDITARKQMERELLEAKATAEAASRAKSAFVANMSHEIRTPMTAILGYADLLLNPNQTAEDRRRCIQTIHRNGQHLLAIINDILDASKIESGKMTVEKIACSPLQIVADVAALMKVRAADKSLAFDVLYRGAVPRTIRSDPTRLRQVLVNLVGNAIKFTPKGSVKVLVSMMDPPTAAHPRLRFDVIDTGVGMSPGQQEMLFKPFAQADSSTTRRFGGTGLGLIISRRLTQLLGGDVLVHSEFGAGSTFSAVIDTGPLAGVEMVQAPQLHMPSADLPREQPADVRMSGRVLVAEDGPDNRVLITYHLQQAGLEVTVVENGIQARDAALAAEHAGRPFDLILMDMQMPELDGYSATVQLRQAGYRRPIVALTAHALADDRQKCLEAGCNDFATKPIEHDVLMRAIRRFLHERQPDQPTAPAGLAQAASAGSESILGKLMAKPGTARLVERFLSGLGQRIAAIQQALAANDLEQLKILAHQLKGAAGGYGFPHLTDAARKVEHAAVNNASTPTLATEVRALADLCQQIKAAA